MLKLINIFRGGLKRCISLDQPKSLYHVSSVFLSEGKKGQGDKGEKGGAKNPKQADNKNKKDEKQNKNIENQKANAKDNKNEKQQGKKEDNKDIKKQETGSNDVKTNENKKSTVSLKNEKYEITHHYEKKGSSLAPNQKQQLQTLVSKMLQEEGITSTKAEEIKKELRNPLNNSLGRYLNQIQSGLEAFKHINNFTDAFFYNRTFEALDRLIRYRREIMDEKDPAFIQIRSQHRLMYNGNITQRVPHDTDMRQNVNSKEWLKPQPRLTEINYSYNIEGHKEFYRKFPQFVKEDKKAIEEKQKLYKYMKLHPDNQQIRLRFIPRNLPNGITVEKIPDYNVDITGYKPTITKKSRRKFDRPRVDTNFKNYQAWRCFDRVFMTFAEEMDFIRVELIPKNLINRFSVPCTPQHEDITGQYYLEDENLDLFLVCDFKQTEESNGPNFNDDFYKQLEYEKISNPNLPDFKKSPLPQEFWEITEPREFRIYYQRYSEVKKFKRWLQVYVNYFDPAKDKTMDQILDDKFGKFDDYSDHSKTRVEKTVPAIYYYSRDYFMDKEEKRIVEHDPIVFPKYISKTEGELFDYEEMVREEAAKGVKREKEEVL